MSIILRALSQAARDQYEFTIRKSRDGQYFWTLHSAFGNTEPVATSETYTTKQSAQHSIDRVKELAGTAKITDLSGS